VPIVNGLEVDRALVLSIGHLPPTEADQLAGDTRLFSLAYPDGFMVWVDATRGDALDVASDDDEPAMPHLAAIERLAHSQVCQWVRFDSDGPTVGYLPRFPR
jgi:hypothetical protein